MLDKAFKVVYNFNNKRIFEVIDMKYFSEKLNQAYETEAELRAAESAYDAAQANNVYNYQTTTPTSTRAKKKERDCCLEDCCDTECCLKCECDMCSCAECSCCGCL